MFWSLVLLSVADERFSRQPATNPFPLVDTSLQNPQFMQPQFTAIAPQFTSFNPYQQQAQQEAMQVRNYTTRCSGLP